MERALAAIRAGWTRGGGGFECWNSSERTFERRELVQREEFTTMMVSDLLTTVPAARSLNQTLIRTVAARARTDGLFHFFVDRDLIPADADCTATGTGLLLRHGVIDPLLARQVVDRVLGNVDQDGVVQTYFDAAPRRQNIIDPVVCANVLHLAAMCGRLDEAGPTRAFLIQVLRDRLYLFGTRYYPRAENFLYFLARLVADFPIEFGELHSEVRVALAEQRGASSFPLDRAQWLHASARLGVVDEELFAEFLALQGPDGAWPIDAFFRYGRSGIYFGTETVTTAMAVSLMQRVRELGVD